MKTIYKYKIEILDEQNISMPLGAKIIHAGLDPQGQTCVWALVDTNLKTEYREIYVRGTGHDINNDFAHVGSFVSGQFVWHVFTSH